MLSISGGGTVAAREADDTARILEPNRKDFTIDNGVAVLDLTNSEGNSLVAGAVISKTPYLVIVNSRFSQLT